MPRYFFASCSFQVPNISGAGVSGQQIRTIQFVAACLEKLGWYLSGSTSGCFICQWDVL